MKKINNNKNIVEAMKDCFRKRRFPIFEDFHSKGPLSFRSKFGDEDFSIYIWVWYDPESEYANVRIACPDHVSSERMADTRELLNLANGREATHHYWVCAKCGMVYLNTGLFVPGSRLPERKFERLLSWAFEDISQVFLLVYEMEAEGGSPEDLMSEVLNETPRSLGINKGFSR